MKVLILVWFYDIGCDIGGFGFKVCEMLDITGVLVVFCLGALK